jgi:tellurite resistance protein TehA-like permease
MAPHAAVLSRFLPQSEAFRIILAGTTVQGVGFLVSVTVYSAYIYRLMTQKLPEEALRPGMFVSVGPSAFTVAGLIGMGENIRRAVPADFMGDEELAAAVLRILANFVSLWLWG